MDTPMYQWTSLWKYVDPGHYVDAGLGPEIVVVAPSRTAAKQASQKVVEETLDHNWVFVRWVRIEQFMYVASRGE